jgi:tyrosyl-tRNA synthetase
MYALLILYETRRVLKMSFLKEFTDREYLYQATAYEELEKLTSTEQVGFYVGFDCTAESLHVGNLMQIMILRLLQKHGHKPIVIVGGGTTKIGDPSGKDETRKMLTDEDIARNIEGIKKSLSKFIRFGDGKNDAIILNNAEWLDNLGYIEFLREYGKEFSVNRMLTMDSVKLRLEREQPLTFLEFNYMLLQAYDFMHLKKHHNCSVQLGGSDQWGNIVMGAELIRKKLSQPAFGLTTPLLTTSSGAKMGKSANGAIWINEEMLSPYEYFQYWRNTEDLDVIKFSKLYAEFNDEEQNEFNNLCDSQINEAKKKLAHKLTEICHGKENADNALNTSIKVFEEGGADDNLAEIFLSKEELIAGISIIDLLVSAEFSPSKSEAKKLIRAGGARINNEKIEDENFIITSSDLSDNVHAKLSAGKKRHVILKMKQ